jgi:hypothetical protein
MSCLASLVNLLNWRNGWSGQSCSLWAKRLRGAVWAEVDEDVLPLSLALLQSLMAETVKRVQPKTELESA